MGMAYTGPLEPKWRARARRVHFLYFEGKKVVEMDELEIEHAFHQLAKRHGIYYTWCDNHLYPK